MEHTIQDVDYEVVEQEEGTKTGRRRGPRSKADAFAGKTEAEIAELEKEIAEDRRLSLIDETFGNGRPYDREQIEFEIGQYLKRSAADFLEIGFRLIQLKEHEGHGNFLPCLGRIGIGEDAAERMMLTARKLQGTEIANSARRGILLPSKLYEIALFDSDQIEDLERDGAIAGITLDDIQRMTTREVREALREERKKRKEEIASRERVIKEKNDKIDELDRELRGMPPKSSKEIAEKELRALTVKIISECVKMQESIRTMSEFVDAACRLPGAEMERLKKMSDEIIDYGTEAVINAWEVLSDEVVAMMPKEALPDVPALG